MSVIWLPVEGGIVPRGDPSGPIQEEERFFALETALEDARSEHRLRRLDTAEAILANVIPKAASSKDHRYGLLAASAYSLLGRIHWRRIDRGIAHQSARNQEEAKQQAAFRKALELFRKHRRHITQDMPRSRINTDYAIALFRSGRTRSAISVLREVQRTGVMPAEAFAYLGIAYRASGELDKAVRALKSGLELAPGNKVLLENLAKTLDARHKNEEALRVYCRAAVAAGKENDLGSARDLLQAALKIRSDDAQALSMLTLLLRSQGDDASAKRLLENTLKRHPTLPWALGLRAMILRDQGERELALEDFRQICVTSADLAWVLIEHAKTVAAKDESAARALLDHAAELLGDSDPRVAQARIQIQVQVAISGVVRFGRKTIDSLRAVVDNATKSRQARDVTDQLGPEALLEPREAVARALLEQQKFTDAAAAADAALAVAPDSARLLALKAKALNLKGDLAEAARFYRRAARAAPEDEEIFAALIDVLRRAGQPDEALRELDHRIATLANSGRALAEKGHLLFGMERFEDAARVLEQALSVTPPEKRFDLQMQLGQSWRRLGQYGKAIDGFAFAARSDNAYSDARAFHASSLIEVADYWQAATVLQAAIDGFSADRTEDRGRRSLGWLWDARGWAIRQTGADMREVTALFRTATEIDPGNSQAKMDLGCALLRDSRTYGEGATTLQALIDAGTAVQGPKQLVGWCYYMLRQYELAEHWLRSLVESNKTDIGMRFDLAVVLLASNAPDAEQEYKSASKMAQQEGRLRQRGLFHVALTDLIDAVDESRIDPSRALQVCQRLWDRLEVAGLRKAELMRLKQAARLQPAD